MPGSVVVINGNYAAAMPTAILTRSATNLGMHHANTPAAEYGESSCIMAVSRHGQTSL